MMLPYWYLSAETLVFEQGKSASLICVTGVYATWHPSAMHKCCPDLDQHNASMQKATEGPALPGSAAALSQQLTREQVASSLPIV